MDDLISRQAAIDAVAKEMPSLTTPDGSGEFDHDIQIADEAFVDCMQIINELPPAQPEIIRCKDCKYFERRSIYHHGLCDVHCNGVGEKEVTSEGQYCSWAKRKEE